MARRSDHTRVELREMALQAAESILEQDGIQGLTARRIAARIDYTVGSLYLLFRNLDDLVMHVNARTLDELAEAIETAVSRCRQPRRCVLALGHAYVQFAMDNPERWRLLFRQPLSGEETVPGWYARHVARIQLLMEQQLEPLAGKRSRRKLTLAARSLCSAVHGVSLLAMDRRLGFAWDNDGREITDTLIENYLAGFAAQ